MPTIVSVASLISLASKLLLLLMYSVHPCVFQFVLIKQISHFIEVGVCVIFAVITMMMLMASFRLQRDAAVAAEKKQFLYIPAFSNLS